MKIIHCADLHLGSKINSRLKKITDDRKNELRNSFIHLCEYATSNNIKIIMLSGDVFDSDKPSRKDKEAFYALVKKYSHIDFLYLKGNHDILNDDEKLDNLKTFTDDFISYRYDNICITGIELNKSNSLSFYNNLNFKKEDINILMLHGQIADSVGEALIKISDLKNKYIDYLALGHIHSFSHGKIDSRGIYAYSGCLEGRGFDEVGQKGFILLDIDANKINFNFIPFCCRQIIVENVDITLANSILDIVDKIKNNVNFNSNNIYRINLIGDLLPDKSFLPKDIESYFSNLYFIEVVFNTNIVIDYNQYINDLSLKGEFVRTLMADESINDADKKEITSLGLKLLEGREV